MKAITITLISLFVLFTSSFAQKDWEILFFDDFNRTDGELGENYDVTLYPEGNASISNNEAVVWGLEASILLWMIEYNQEVHYDSIKVSAKFRSSIPDTAEMFGYGMMAKKDTIDGFYMVGAGINANMITISHYTADYITATLLASKFMELDGSKAYLLEFTVNYNELILTVTEIETQISETVSYEVTGTPVSGPKTSLNGYNSPGVDVFIDDFKIERNVANSSFSLTKENLIRFYPNPVSDFAYFMNIDNAVYVQLFSVNGQIISDYFIDRSINHIDLSELRLGIYFLKIYSEEMKVLKLIKL